MTTGDLFDADSILLTDRIAVVTGAAQGIGRATARLFARCGATVAICDRQADLLAEVAADIERLGRPVLSAELDVRDPEAVDAFVESIADRFDRVDVLVNNAGGTFVAPFLDIAPKGEASIIAENFTQVTHFVRRVAPLMTNGGSIINLTSIEAHQAGPGFSVYAAMKAAVANITGTLALELGSRNIRVNAIASDAQPSGGEKEARKAMLDGQARVHAGVHPAARLLRHPRGLRRGRPLPGQRPLPLHQRHHPPRRRRQPGRRRLAPARLRVRPARGPLR